MGVVGVESSTSVVVACDVGLLCFAWSVSCCWTLHLVLHLLLLFKVAWFMHVSTAVSQCALIHRDILISMHRLPPVRNSACFCALPVCRHFLASMLRDKVPASLAKDPKKQEQLTILGDTSWGNMSDCKFLSAIHSDYIHLDPMGCLLYVGASFADESVISVQLSAWHVLSIDARML